MAIRGWGDRSTRLLVLGLRGEMPAVAIGTLVHVQRRGAVLGAFGSGELGFATAGIAVLTLAGLAAQGRLVGLVARGTGGRLPSEGVAVGIVPKAELREQVALAERCGELRLLLLPCRALLAAHDVSLPNQNRGCAATASML